MKVRKNKYKWCKKLIKEEKIKQMNYINNLIIQNKVIVERVVMHRIF